MGKHDYHDSHCDMQPWARVVHLASLRDAKQSTSFGWWNVTPAGWQVTLCDHIWHVSSVAVRPVAYYYTRLLYLTT